MSQNEHETTKCLCDFLKLPKAEVLLWTDGFICVKYFRCTDVKTAAKRTDSE